MLAPDGVRASAPPGPSGDGLRQQDQVDRDGRSSTTSDAMPTASPTCSGITGPPNPMHPDQILVDHGAPAWCASPSDADGRPDNMSATGSDQLSACPNSYDNLHLGLGKVGEFL